MRSTVQILSMHSCIQCRRRPQSLAAATDPTIRPPARCVKTELQRTRTRSLMNRPKRGPKTSSSLPRARARTGATAHVENPCSQRLMNETLRAEFAGIYRACAKVERMRIINERVIFAMRVTDIVTWKSDRTRGVRYARGTVQSMRYNAAWPCNRKTSR